MHIATRVHYTLIATLLAIAAAAIGAPACSAAIPTVSPGDQIEYLSPTADVTMFCTIGYVYTAPNLHTYAVTAGHCRGKTAGYARATRSGTTGDFIRQSSNPLTRAAPTTAWLISAPDHCRWPTSATSPPPTTTPNPKKANKSAAREYPAANTAVPSPAMSARTTT